MVSANNSIVIPNNTVRYVIIPKLPVSQSRFNLIKRPEKSHTVSKWNQFFSSKSDHLLTIAKKPVSPCQLWYIPIRVFIDFYVLSTCLWAPEWQKSCLLSSLWLSHWITVSSVVDILSGEMLSATICCWLWHTSHPLIFIWSQDQLLFNLYLTTILYREKRDNIG